MKNKNIALQQTKHKQTKSQKNALPHTQTQPGKTNEKQKMDCKQKHILGFNNWIDQKKKDGLQYNEFLHYHTCFYSHWFAKLSAIHLKMIELRNKTE